MPAIRRLGLVEFYHALKKDNLRRRRSIGYLILFLLKIFSKIAFSDENSMSATSVTHQILPLWRQIGDMDLQKKWHSVAYGNGNLRHKARKASVGVLLKPFLQSAILTEGLRPTDGSCWASCDGKARSEGIFYPVRLQAYRPPHPLGTLRLLRISGKIGSLATFVKTL